MKKVKTALIVLLLLSMVLSGCAGASEKPIDRSNQNETDKGRMKIYASFYPMYFLASEIAGDKAEVISMVPAGAEPHDWEPSPRMVIELSKADMLIYNGVGMEPWIDKILPNINSGKTKIVDASVGIELLKSEKHEEEEVQNGEDHEHGIYDPHIWVSPKRAMQQAQTICQAIVEIDPENSEYYRKNMAELDSKLAKLDKDISDASKSFKSNVIVVSHEAFGYFAKDYRLEQIAITGINPQAEISSSKMIELTRVCKEKNVEYIFFEKLTSPKLSETLAGEVGAGTLVLNDAAGLNEEDIKSGKDYITVMYENLENLKKALGD
ncbi:MAG TPA: metal ABC transporter substrate-binding protein [Clostridia bacterium]|nr:metal ABC transporter substrate-binding protein [Clostridia bacterium]